MADTKISALTAVGTPAGTDEFVVNQGGTSKKMTLAQIETFTGHTLITGATGAVSTEAAPSETIQILTSNNSDIPTTTVVTQLTAQSLPAGWWDVEYNILWQSNVTTTGITFIVDSSATVTTFNAVRHDWLSGTDGLATVGIADSAATTAVAGKLPSVWTTRTDAGALGPNAGVVTINVNQVTLIKVQMLTTTQNDLLLRANSEIASTITRVAAGTNARYRRLS